MVLLNLLSCSHEHDDGYGRFYEPACQVSSLGVAASVHRRHTSSERAPPLHPARGVRANGSTALAVVKRSWAVQALPRGVSSFYSRSGVALRVPAHNEIRRRSSALCGTALTCGQTPTRACSSNLTTSPVTRRTPRRRHPPWLTRGAGRCAQASRDTRSGPATCQTRCGRDAEPVPPWRLSCHAGT